MKKTTLFLISLLFVLTSCANDIKTKPEKTVTKRGLIVPLVDSLKYSEEYCCILLPEQGFSVYDGPKGKIIGTIKRIGDKKTDDQVPYKIYFVSGNKKAEVNNYREIGYELFALNYTDSVQGYLKILDPLKNHWLNVSEIKKHGFKAMSWRDFMIGQSQDVLGYYANEPGLRLRKKPNTDGEIISSVRGDLFEIKLTTETYGQWCKVKVTKYREHPCNTELNEKENIEYKTEGWLKIIDDNGEPNLYNYTRGC
ncbi:hypothetical protein J2X31_003652 [Flavobacterium arsenatis]|uniref:SH3 domain-containing protein n=1 Tax=Flavobacterium arsenatis TaxID=1484332 RepID=A0ABU1TUQ8_9FLAO|nr:SH3 domain-containing protein [Flavobacterium arsenatis]MDR6969619.1 hypothetical protein [Flavobacterium arsenatis]